MMMAAAAGVKTGDKPIGRVAFTCDLARFTLGAGGYRHMQTGNMHWLLAMLGGETAWRRLGVQVRRIEPAADADELGRQVQSPAVLREYEQDAATAWARRFDLTSFDVRPSLTDDLLDSDLVIGFELPRGMRRMLHAHGHPYISFHVHPLRFLRDLCLGAVTNSPALLARLERVVVPGIELEAQINRYSALLARNAWPALAGPADWPLLIAQTARDAILIEQGSFSDWPDHDAALLAAMAGAEGMVLLEHPYRHDSAAIAHHLRALLGKPVVMTNANGYAVLFQARRHRCALTLASSLGVEAQAVGVPTSFLLGDPRQRQLLAGVDLGTIDALHHGVLHADFWEALFTASDGSPRQHVAHSPFSLGDNFLRSSLDAWSYGDLEGGLPALRARKVLFGVESLEADAQQKLCELLSGAVEPAQGWRRIPGAAPGDLGVELVLAALPLSSGEHRELAGSDPWAPLRLRGFHDREPWGVWSAQQDVGVAIAMSPTATHARSAVEIQLQLSVFEDLRSRSPVLRISRHGLVLAEVSFVPGGPEVLDVSVSTVADASWCELDLHLSEITSPLQTSGKPDPRLLGVGLRAVAVKVAPVNGPLPMRHPDDALAPRQPNPLPDPEDVNLPE